MELTTRKGADVFVPPGAYRRLESDLARRRRELAEVPVAVLSCFDPCTRLLPFLLYDRWMFPCGARTIAGALHQAGFAQTRAVFQLWNRRFRSSAARMNGKPLQMLLVSAMQIHSAKAAEAIRDAWSMGDERPLIIAGGPKAIYEPYLLWSQAGQPGAVAPDVAVTGEAYVLLDLLNVVAQFRRRRDTMRTAFERARRSGALESVPGLVYLDPRASLEDPLLVDTGLQRLVQDLDEMPDEVTGLRLLEPAHRGAGLSDAPLADHLVRRYSPIASVLLTQGCKFNCPYCPIPALNQKSWRSRSPEGIVRQFRGMRETFGIRYYFGTDDNFFNRRETAEEILTALAEARLGNGRRMGKTIRWSTEATQYDTYKNRDLLPLARASGAFALWFGIEDLTAELINKGQKPEVTVELFRQLHAHSILPMAMIMYHEGQPFYRRGSLYGLVNQVEFLRRAGAVSVQITVHTPAVGTREFENTYRSGRVVQALGTEPVPDSARDGNHVIVAGAEPMWRRQLQLLLGYATFYNPINLLRSLRRDGSPLRGKRIAYQLAGFLCTLWTIWMLLPYLWRLLTRRPIFHAVPPPQTTVPVRLAEESFPRVPAEPEPIASPRPWTWSSPSGGSTACSIGARPR
jgi:radical SAM superfamily enzyme YgiQ (UPF0313 family)